MPSDSEVLRRLQAAMAALGPDLFEELLKAGAAVPAEWAGWPDERRFEFLRCRLQFTQGELAAKAGLAQSQVSRIEGGCDGLLSTWKKLYAAMGFELVLLPTSTMTLPELRLHAEIGRPQGHFLRQRARPRRRRLRG